MLAERERRRRTRHRRIRKRLRSMPERPRLCVHRSLKNLCIQVIDDFQSKTLFSISTLNKELKDKLDYGGNKAAASKLGNLAAEKLKQKGITKVVFDRGGYSYHGRIKAVAEGLRKGGIVF